MRQDIVVATLLAVIAREHLATADVRILRAATHILINHLSMATVQTWDVILVFGSLQFGSDFHMFKCFPHSNC